MLPNACEPVDDEHVVPLSGRDVNRRLQALAKLVGLAGHQAGRPLAQPADGALYASAVAVEDGAVARCLGGDERRRTLGARPGG